MKISRVAQKNPGKLGFLIKFEFRNICFYEERRIGVPGRKHSREEEVEEIPLAGPR